MNDDLKRAVLNLRHGDTVLASAIEHAAIAHSGMVRDDGGDYIDHPLRVCMIVAEEFGIVESESLILAILHDALESDYAFDAPDLNEVFYRGAAEELQVLTIKIGTTREERDGFYIRRIREGTLRVKLVKLADRLDNLRSLKTNPSPEKKKRYTIETVKNYFPLAESVFPLALQLMKKEIDSMSF
ncbi:(p)ppGpp synthase/HD superfamily hydrolase [Agrobacterium larrymoorei]|uniref:(P)ppGpp synthase/HD superfamily hydrolase n=1 Tax=Agrobacterium larrymoorei TaxID=160699 RepID=A0AAJ2BCS2_9HYPH|nr:HD domain-containing protein [Agrobacterium larrymoorei]MDR6100581.1 (p)ppGpp synthase/HD superfamily hydrolase [Agrobacterium larrymoorei]